MASPFGALLARALARKGMSQRDFARRVGRTGVFISMVVRGTRRVPIADLDRWLDTLAVPDRTREKLRLQALLSHCPAEIQALVEHLQRQSRRRQRRL